MIGTVHPEGVSSTAKGAPVADVDRRPLLAIVVNSMTPYRTHLHVRIAREIGELRLATLVTHEESNSAWPFVAPSEIGPVLFGPGEAVGAGTRARLGVGDWRKGGRLVRWLAGENLGAVVVAGYSDIAMVRVLRWCRGRVPCLMYGDANIRGDVTRGLKRLIKSALVPALLRPCAAVLACGSLGEAYYRKYGVPSEKLFRVPYEPDYDGIARIPQARVADARRRFRLDENRRHLLFSGRLVSVKRPDLVADAFVRIAPTRPEWDLVVVGDGPLRAEMEARIPPRLAARVRWTGFLDDAAVAQSVYRACDVLVLPSDLEPWGVVVGEAAAAGLALVCSDTVGAAAELVREGTNGGTFRAGSLDALIERLLEATDARRIDRYRAASADALRDWRVRGDPVQGLRAALREAGVLLGAGAKK